LALFAPGRQNFVAQFIGSDGAVVKRRGQGATKGCAVLV